VHLAFGQTRDQGVEHQLSDICRAGMVTAAHVRFGSKADIEKRASDVRFTPKSGHQAFMSRRTSSGSLAMFAAIRRVSSCEPAASAPRS
jgi:hypothetical protein